MQIFLLTGALVGVGIAVWLYRVVEPSYVTRLYVEIDPSSLPAIQNQEKLVSKLTIDLSSPSVTRIFLNEFISKLRNNDKVKSEHLLSIINSQLLAKPRMRSIRIENAANNSGFLLIFRSPFKSGDQEIGPKLIEAFNTTVKHINSVVLKGADFSRRGYEQEMQRETSQRQAVFSEIIEKSRVDLAAVTKEVAAIERSLSKMISGSQSESLDVAKAIFTVDTDSFVIDDEFSAFNSTRRYGAEIFRYCSRVIRLLSILKAGKLISDSEYESYHQQLLKALDSFGDPEHQRLELASRDFLTYLRIVSQFKVEHFKPVDRSSEFSPTFVLNDDIYSFQKAAGGFESRQYSFILILSLSVICSILLSAFVYYFVSLAKRSKSPSSF